MGLKQKNMAYSASKTQTLPQTSENTLTEDFGAVYRQKKYQYFAFLTGKPE